MIDSPFAATPPILRCPHFDGQLLLHDRALVCPHGHSFDLAREGYVNLLRSKQTGDTKQMLRARREFLAAGHYQPLSDLVNRLVRDHLAELLVQRDPPPGSAQILPERCMSIRPQSARTCHATAVAGPSPPQPEAASCTLLDAGCGEGYYLGRLQRHLLDDPPCHGCRLHIFGLDASKDAARLAAARYTQAALLVADLKERLPFADRSLDVLLNIFAPRNPDEFARVLRPNGLLLVVIPGPEHLRELRDALNLLAMEEQKEQHVVASLSGHFAESGVQRLAYTMQLAGDDLVRLVAMTPNARHDSETRRLRLDELRGTVLPVTASFIALTFQPRYTLEGR